MGAGLPGGASLMEDYTYHLVPGEELILGAHMLEVSPSLTTTRPTLEIHPLGIGGREDPVRLVFTADPGPAVVAALSDMRDRFRLTVNAVNVVPPTRDLPKLPVGRAVWQPEPDFTTSATAWLTAGAAHHTVMSTAIGVDVLRDFADHRRPGNPCHRQQHHHHRIRQPGPLEPGLLPTRPGPVAPRGATESGACSPCFAIGMGRVTMPAASGDDSAGRPRHPPALLDVGKYAGVSHQTVSRVLNGHPNVKPETRKKVLDAISAARLSAEHRGPGPRHEEVGDDRRPHPRFTVVRADQHSAVGGVGRPRRRLLRRASQVSGCRIGCSLTRSLEHFMSQAVEGLVVVAPQDFAAQLLAQSAGDVPTVVVADAPALPHFHSVAVDQSAGASIVVSHLVSLGHRSIVHLSGSPDWFDARARVAGWRASMEAAGTTARPAAAGRLDCRVRLPRRVSLIVRGCRMRSSRPTTKWRSVCCGRCGNTACLCPRRLRGRVRRRRRVGLLRPR